MITGRREREGGRSLTGKADWRVRERTMDGKPIVGRKGGRVMVKRSAGSGEDWGTCKPIGWKEGRTTAADNWICGWKRESGIGRTIVCVCVCERER